MLFTVQKLVPVFSLRFPVCVTGLQQGVNMAPRLAVYPDDRWRT